MFQFHLATHDNKKALLSIKVNDKEIASVFDQNHKDNHKNSMAGTNVVHNVKRGDKVTGQCFIKLSDGSILILLLVNSASGDTLRLHRDLAGGFPR